MPSRLRPAAVLLSSALLAGSLFAAGCGDDGAVEDAAPETSTEVADDPYRLTVSSSRGKTEALRASICGEPSSPLVELPCGLSLGFVRGNATRLYVGRVRDRVFLELERPASAIFTSLAQPSGERGLMRRSALTKLGERGRKASIGLGPETADLPTVQAPTYLSVVVVFQDEELPAPRPLASGVPDDAVVRGATAEYLVQLATRTQAGEN